MILKTNSLTDVVKQVVCDKGTEKPFSGELNAFEQAGTYLCRQCGLPLFHSQTKFHSQCGWPSFDENLPGAVATLPDLDGMRSEIVCSRCQAHLGHVFAGERFTDKNLRHCVNSLSLDFVPVFNVIDTEEAIFAAGCFWGVEHYLRRLPGVLKTEVGYSGGMLANPNYEEVCQGNSGHLEVIRVLFDPYQLDYESLCKYFFEIHDPTQTDGQGPDIGQQYLSAIFYYNDEQKQIAEKLISILIKKGLHIATQVRPMRTFWRAETYHQNYYAKSGSHPYCHHYEKKFD